MKIKVTQKYIQDGEPNEPSGCPIALAVCDALELRGSDEVEVEYETLTVTKYLKKGCGSLQVAMDLPAKLQRFITRFDEGKKVKPFVFEW